jgi:hypothetical protein
MPFETLITQEEELALEKEAPKISEPKPGPEVKQSKRSVLVEIFAGHEDFLGYTPD